MTTDRELLESAAKSVGGGSWHPLTHDTPNGRWNPLTDDGDALRLAVKLRIVIDVGSIAAHVYKDGPGVVVPLDPEPYAATRRAIVRAAAAIGAAK